MKLAGWAACSVESGRGTRNGILYQTRGQWAVVLGLEAPDIPFVSDLTLHGCSTIRNKNICLTCVVRNSPTDVTMIALLAQSTVHEMFTLCHSGLCTPCGLEFRRDMLPSIFVVADLTPNELWAINEDSARAGVEDEKLRSHRIVTFISRLMHSIILNLEVKMYVV